MIGPPCKFTSKQLVDVSPCQIHWPVASQRKTECVLSGKDTNVSIPFTGRGVKSRDETVELLIKLENEEKSIKTMVIV